MTRTPVSGPLILLTQMRDVIERDVEIRDVIERDVIMREV
jgi:hypothetical protein